MSNDNIATDQRRLAFDPRMPKVGQMVGQRYRILDILGEGGFAVVYRANDDRLGGEVAFKVLEPGKSADSDFAQRFHQEINLVRQLKHHNTIKIWDAGVTESGCLYMATELITGSELSRMIPPGNGLPIDRVVRIVSQVLKSLAEAHRVGIVHRDLKPSNIMVSQLDGEPDYVKVLDFGIAKALAPGLSMVETQTGIVMCTPSYASPEVLRGHAISPASDLYSLGLIMIEMLTGRQAVQGSSMVDIMGQQISPDPIQMPEEIASEPIGAIIARATAKRVDQRYQSAVEMLTDLANLAFSIPITPSGVKTPVFPVLPTGPTVQAPGPTLPASLATQVQRRNGPLLWIASLLGLLVVLAAVIAIVLLSKKEPSEPGHTQAGEAGLAQVAGSAQSTGKPAEEGAAPHGGAAQAGIQTPAQHTGVPPGALVTTQGQPWVQPPAGSPSQGAIGDPQAALVPAGQTLPGQGGPSPAQAGSAATQQPTGGQNQGLTPSGLPILEATTPAQTTPEQPPAEPSSQPVANAPGLQGTQPSAIPGQQEGQETAESPRPPTIQPELPELAPNQVRASVLYRVPRGDRTLLILTGCGEESGLSEGSEGEIEGGSATANITLITSEQDCEAESQVSMEDLGTVTSVLFTLPDTEPAEAAQQGEQTEGTMTVTIEGSPRSVRLVWRYTEGEDREWSDSVRCSRPCELELPDGNGPIEIRARKSDHCSESITIDPAANQTSYTIDLQPGCTSSTRGLMCTNTCQWAFDGECDDGGPRSLYNLCPLGTDCYDCGPREIR
ncbi:MAG: protein kinase [Bradymonadales bacterium]|nr:protein kinase [Bradymonadales bacterium]